MKKFTQKQKDMLRKSRLELEQKIQEQEEREKNDPPDRVRIQPNMLWYPLVKTVWMKGEQFPLAEISVGWTAGMSDEDIKNLSENAPTWKNSIQIPYEYIDELIEELKKVKEQNENNS